MSATDCIDVCHNGIVIVITEFIDMYRYTYSMIHLIREGKYQLLETKGQTKILVLDMKKSFAWVNVTDIGEILITTQKRHKTDTILSVGRYRLYDVKDEEHLTDLQHLELYAGDKIWQGYLLTNGLPTIKKKRNRIIPTQEIITKTTH